MKPEDLISAVVIVIVIFAGFMVISLAATLIVPIAFTSLAVFVVYQIIQEEKKSKK